jgi:hypothetical protein
MPTLILPQFRDLMGKMMRRIPSERRNITKLPADPAIGERKRRASGINGSTSTRALMQQLRQLVHTHGSRWIVKLLMATKGMMDHQRTVGDSR